MLFFVRSGFRPCKLMSHITLERQANLTSSRHLWNTSKELKQHRRPDIVFCWNLAVAALQEDFLSSTVSTVHAAVLDLAGRPVISIPGNISTLGRTVTLAHSLGLHRDPSAWSASRHEKNVRIRVFWGVAVHDAWYVILGFSLTT